MAGTSCCVTGDDWSRRVSSCRPCSSSPVPWRSVDLSSLRTSTRPTLRRASWRNGRSCIVIGNVPRFLSYQAGTTFLHRLDPRTKLLCTAAIVGDALIAGVPYGIGIALGFAAVIGLMAADLLPALWRLLRPLLVLIVIFGLIITVITPGHALAHFWLLAPSRDGVDLAIRLGLQAVLIVYTTS